VRVCIKCCKRKPFVEFVKDVRGRGGYRTYCISCDREYQRTYRIANREKVNKTLYAWAKRHPEKTAEIKKRSRARIIEHGFTAARKATLKSLFNLSPEQYMSLIAQQGGVCPCCRRALPASLAKQHVDHDHVTHRVRGVTCGNCNRAMGMFGDNPETMRNAADYLEAHNAQYRTDNAGMGLQSAPDNIEVYAK
jgi:hypothetical protein